MKRYFGISLVCMSILSLLAGMVMAKPSDQRYELAPSPFTVDLVGDVDGTAPVVSKAAADTIWIGTWNFEGCDETGWVRSDNRIISDGMIHWSVDTIFTGINNIVGDAAAISDTNSCWVFSPGYDNSWYEGMRISYVGDSFLSFDFLLDAETDFDFLQVETDSACSSFNQVDYDLDPLNGAETFRTVIWELSGLDSLVIRVDSLALSGFATGDTHCVYIAFFSDGGGDPADGFWTPTYGAGAVVDNVLIQGAMPVSEDFTGFVESADFAFMNMDDAEPFGAWARTFSHITDNDICSENPTCAWLSTDNTTPTFANDPSMGFGPNGYVIKNWWDDVVVGPWVSLASTPSAISTVIQFRRFGGNFFSTSRAVQNWSIRGKDSNDCVSAWGHRFSWNSLSTFSWRTLAWDATAEFESNSTDVQVRFRQSDWQWIAGASPPGTFRPGPGPYWDRVRIGRQVLTGPVIDEGIDARYQAQDAAPNDPAIDSGPNYAQAAGDDIFGTTAFSRGTDGGTNNTTANLIVGDSITVNVIDALQVGLTSVDVYAAIVAGPHAGKAPAPYSLGGNGFFVITADSSRSPSTGTVIADNYFVDFDDDTYFRGGDVLQYVWLAGDANGGFTSNPVGLSGVPTSIADAQMATGGMFEVNFLPTINWDPVYLTRITDDGNGGDLVPTADELLNSSQKNCILYYQVFASRRRSGDINRTAFMYTLDKLGYRGEYDQYDLSGAGNTNNQLGARMSPGQAKGYSLVVFDAGTLTPGFILPDGIDLDAEKINMSAWFQTWNSLSGAPNPEHTLWIISANVMEEKPANGLWPDMGASFVAADQAQDSNPDVFGIANFTNHSGCETIHVGDEFAMAAGCPIIRDYDDIRPIGSGVQTHVYGKGAPSTAGAIVMNANAAGYSTIIQSFSWREISASIGQSPTSPGEDLMATILGCALPVNCAQAIDPTDVPEDGDQIAAPSRTTLHQNTPNPFNPTTTINFDLARDSHVSLKIYDVAGRLVRGLKNEKMVAGFGKEVVWNGLNNSGNRVSSGVYFYRLVAGDVTATKKMVVMK